jgi:hypothetical protein
MSAKSLVAFRSVINEKELKEITLKKLHYPSVSEFINEAVKEKLNRETGLDGDPEVGRLVSKLTEVIHEYKGWKFMKVSPELAKKIDQVADPIISGKVKGTTWKGSFDKTFPPSSEKSKSVTHRNIVRLKVGKKSSFSRNAPAK